MRKNYVIFALFLAFAVQLTTAFAQTTKLGFKQLIDATLYKSIEQGMKTPADVHRIKLDVTGLTKLPAELEKFPNLQMVYLSGNTRKLNWTTVATEMLKLKNLEYIYFQDEGLTTLPAQVFTLKNLKGIAVINGELSAVPVEIAKLPNLEYLILINNNISALPVQVSSLKNLKVLYLDGNNIAAFPPQMANLKKLEELSVAGNPMKEEELKKIRKYYPAAKIIETYDLPVVEDAPPAE